MTSSGIELMDFPREIFCVLAYHTDYYTLTALMATCRTFRSLRYESSLFYNKIRDELGEYNCTYFDEKTKKRCPLFCSWDLYKQVLLFRWRYANLLVQRLYSYPAKLLVFGSWIADMFAGPLLFRRITIHTDCSVKERFTVVGKRPYSVSMSGACYYLSMSHAAFCPDDPTVTFINTANGISVYEIEITTSGMRVKFEMEFVHDGSKLSSRQCYFDTDAMVINEIDVDHKYYEIGLWPSQFLESHGPSTFKLKTTLCANYTKLDGFPSSRTKTFSVPKAYLPEGLTPDLAIQYIQQLCSHCRDRSAYQLSPMKGELVYISSLWKLLYSEQILWTCIGKSNSEVLEQMDKALYSDPVFLEVLRHAKDLREHGWKVKIGIDNCARHRLENAANESIQKRKIDEDDDELISVETHKIKRVCTYFDDDEDNSNIG